MQPAPRGPGGASGRANAPLLAQHHHPFVRIVIAIVIITALAALVAYIVVRLTNRRSGHASMAMVAPPMAMAGAPRSDAALDQLRVRYARGEMSRADYLQAASDLGAPAPAEPPPPTNPV